MIVKFSWFLFCCIMPFAAWLSFWLFGGEVISQRTAGDRFLFILMTIAVALLVQAIGWFILLKILKLVDDKNEC